MFNNDIELFTRFLTEVYDIDDLNFFLLLQTTTQNYILNDSSELWR